MAAAPYPSLCLSEEQADDPETLATVLDTGRALATISAQAGPDALDDFEAERGTRWREPITLGELRDFLGY